MNVAFLSHEPFYPPSGGGSAEAIYLVREMVRRGHRVHLFCPAFPEAERVTREFQVVPHLFTRWAMGRYTSWRTPKYLAYPLFLSRQVRQAARNEPFDAVLSQHAIAAVAAGRLKRSLGIPAVMNYLDYLTGFMETWPRYLAPRWCVHALMRYELSLPNRYQADGVMTVSDPLADRLAATGYPRERLQPIYYGYDANLFHYTEPNPDDAATPVVVMHGSFDRHHLGAIAREALLRVAQMHPKVRFRFVGRETETLQRFRAALESVLPPSLIECTGFVPYAEVARQLAGAALGVVPYEASTGVHCAFVAKIVEYLALGLPVVSTPLESARSYFASEPRIRFSEFDGASFGRQMLAWLDEPAAQRQAGAQAASQRVREQLDWQVISRNALDFVERIWRSQPAP